MSARPSTAKAFLRLGLDMLMIGVGVLYAVRSVFDSAPRSYFDLIVALQLFIWFDVIWIGRRQTSGITVRVIPASKRGA